MERITHRYVTPLTAGLIIGALAVLAGTIGGLNPPESYGFCTTCHGRDLVIGLLERLKVIEISPASQPLFWPLLTTLGVICGAWIGRRASGEAKPKLRGNHLRAVLLGFLAMSFAQLALGCPIRLTLGLANLDWNAGIGLAGVAAGVGLGTFWLRLRA